jgi:hypothetical protein
MNKQITNIIMGLILVLFMGVLVGCPVDSPKEKKKSGDDGEIPLVCPPATNTLKTKHPTNKAELTTAIDDAITKDGSDANLNHIDTSLITDMSKLFEGNVLNPKYGAFVGNISEVLVFHARKPLPSNSHDSKNIAPMVSTALTFQSSMPLNFLARRNI